MDKIQLKHIDYKINNKIGYGSRRGSIITEVYQCVCGKGTVTYENDDIPGFKTKSILPDCPDCEEKYEFARGTAILKSN